MFNLKSPCITCPFRRGQGELFRLRPKRLQEITTAPAFQCHKTVDYDGDKPSSGNRPNQCAGLMAVLHRSGKPNQMMQVGERLSALDPSQLDPRGEAYASLDEAFEAHNPRR